MRAVLVIGAVAMLLAFGSSASAGVFPDLPGLSTAERATHARSLDSKSSTSVSDTKTKTDRVPAPDSNKIVTASMPADKIETVAKLPGGGSLPIIRDALKPASSSGGALALQLLFALFVTALFTRFLVRLNSIR